MKSGSRYGPRCQGSYCCGVRVRPEVWLASSPSVTLRMSPPCWSSGTYLATGSSSAASPCFTPCARKVPRNTFSLAAGVERGLGGDGSVAGAAAKAVVKKQGGAVESPRARHAAGGDQHRLHVLADEPLHLGIVGARRDGRRHRRGGKRCRHHRRRHHPHRSLPSAARSRVTQRRIHYAAAILSHRRGPSPLFAFI